MVDGATREDRLIVANTILATLDDQFLVFDVVSFTEDQMEHMKLLTFFNWLCSLVCFILGTFQLIVTLAANIKDSMWELGVLRSIGCTRHQISRVMIYELIANTLAAMVLGLMSGIIVSILAIRLFYTIVELPFEVELPLQTMAILFLFTLMSLFLGAKYGTSAVYSKNIA